DGAPIRALTPAQFVEFRTSMAAKVAAPHKTNPGSRQVLLDLEDFMIATGVRPNEALAIRWSDVDLEAGVVEINGTVYRKKLADGGGLHIQPHTKGRDDRKLALPGFCLAMLERRREEGSGEVVFASAAGTIMDPDTYRGRRRELLQGTGFEWVTPKIARKAVATLISEQMGSAAAAKQLGHASDAVTKKHYIFTERATIDHSNILEAFGFSKPTVNLQSADHDEKNTLNSRGN
ncbi:MAG: hypothetical protein JWO93_46, partial [Micrococcaceae bacterium]|nr:hypothetical protein [Micrococcaceae bacterium]